MCDAAGNWLLNPLHKYHSHSTQLYESGGDSLNHVLSSLLPLKDCWLIL